ncbi:hypothetical protein ACFW2T_18980 [Streptomyces sp. NPDC058892]|uniref:hypothetical protein n=1 Tax=unclassified Streptomyces TaxID=2593676 RepID=UPI0036AADB5D
MPGPVPLVAARAVGKRATPDAPPSLQLLAARPLALGTRDVAGMGSAPAAAPRTAGRPVVPARWSAPSATAPQQVQRAAAPAPGTAAPAAPGRTGRSTPTAPTAPAVRPAPVSAAAPARTAAALLPVTGPYTPPLVVQSAPAAPASGSVPVVRPGAPAPTALPGPSAPGPAAPAPPPSPPAPGPPPPVQRDTGRTGPTATATAAARPGGGREAAPHGGGDLDLDDLARRLLDPVARLLRTELRRGRERAGRPFDGRR